MVHQIETSCNLYPKLTWDAGKQEFLNDPEDNALTKVNYRTSWSLPFIE